MINNDRRDLKKKLDTTIQYNHNLFGNYSGLVRTIVAYFY